MRSVDVEIPLPDSSQDLITLADVTYGKSLTPLERLDTMNSASWEQFTLELVTAWKKEYRKVVRCGGGGDKGRDVIAYLENGWENFQCKFYSSRLSVAEAIVEIGKTVHYTYIKDYPFPQRYYFVSSQGCSVDLMDCFSDKTGKKLKDELFSRWDQSCSRTITKRKIIQMDDSLRAYIDTLDFTIFNDIPPLRLIEIHKKTPYHSILFGNAPARKRPQPPKAPSEVDWATEQTYVLALEKAFEQNQEILNGKSAQSRDMFEKELTSARNNFYSAEALDKFSRDWLPVDRFQDLKDECHEAISSTVSLEMVNGYTRYFKVNEQAVRVEYSSHPLALFMKTQDKKGLCHHLVNDGRIEWVAKVYGQDE